MKEGLLRYYTVRIMNREPSPKELGARHGDTVSLEQVVTQVELGNG